MQQNGSKMPISIVIGKKLTATVFHEFFNKLALKNVYFSYDELSLSHLWIETKEICKQTRKTGNYLVSKS